MQIKGELEPEQLRHYNTPVVAYLRYQDIQKDPFPTPQEAAVKFSLGGKDEGAFVPLSIVDEDSCTVRAILLGEQQGRILVSFPPTNFGQTLFFAQRDELEAIVDSIEHLQRLH